jgi:hypothetical protein
MMNPAKPIRFFAADEEDGRNIDTKDEDDHHGLNMEADKPRLLPLFQKTAMARVVSVSPAAIVFLLFSFFLVVVHHGATRVDELEDGPIGALNRVALWQQQHYDIRREEVVSSPSLPGDHLQQQQRVMIETDHQHQQHYQLLLRSPGMMLMTTTVPPPVPLWLILLSAQLFKVACVLVILYDSSSLSQRNRNSCCHSSSRTALLGLGAMPFVLDAVLSIIVLRRLDLALFSLACLVPGLILIDRTMLTATTTKMPPR